MLTTGLVRLRRLRLWCRARKRVAYRSKKVLERSRFRYLSRSQEGKDRQIDDNCVERSFHNAEGYCLHFFKNASPPSKRHNCSARRGARESNSELRSRSRLARPIRSQRLRNSRFNSGQLHDVDVTAVHVCYSHRPVAGSKVSLLFTSGKRPTRPGYSSLRISRARASTPFIDS